MMGTPLSDEIDRLRTLNAELLTVCKAALRDLTVPQHAQGFDTVPLLKAAIKHAEEVQP